MKKILVAAILMMANIQYAIAADIPHAANIKMKITGTNPNNTYFLCLQSVGCLSIHAANKGKVYPVKRDVPMSQMFVVNQNTRELFKQGLPDSCQGEVKVDQTVTITGKLEQGPNNSVHIKQLGCSIA